MSKKRGDIVYAYERKSKSYLKAAIKEVNPEYYVLQCLAIVDPDGEQIMEFPGVVGCRKGECFSDLFSLKKYQERREKKQMEIYENSIVDVKALLRFPLIYPISNTEGYTDEIAQKVYKKKVLEYFFIDLDEEY